MPLALMTYLTDHGYELLGSGIYASVYAKKNENIVLKVGQHDATDDPWIDYIEWMGTQQSNCHFPRVGKIWWHTDDKGKRFYVVAMERLTHHINAAQTICSKFQSLDNWVTSGGKVNELDRYLKDWRSSNKDLVSAFVKMRKKFPLYKLDMHPANILFRGNVPVITDPLSFRPNDYDH